MGGCVLERVRVANHRAIGKFMGMHKDCVRKHEVDEHSYHRSYDYAYKLIALMHLHRQSYKKVL